MKNVVTDYGYSIVYASLYIVPIIGVFLTTGYYVYRFKKNHGVARRYRNGILYLSSGFILLMGLYGIYLITGIGDDKISSYDISVLEERLNIKFPAHSELIKGRTVTAMRGYHIQAVIGLTQEETDNFFEELQSSNFFKHNCDIGRENANCDKDFYEKDGSLIRSVKVRFEKAKHSFNVEYTEE